MIDKLVIDRAKWGQGALVTITGKMCCLGFLSAACGVPLEKMWGQGYPAREWVDKYGVPREFALGYDACAEAVNTNDDTNMPGPDKEQKLKNIFAENGIALSFTGAP